MGHLAHDTIVFLISKLMFTEHSVTDTKKHKTALCSQESSLLAGQEDIYSNSYSVLQSGPYSRNMRAWGKKESLCLHVGRAGRVHGRGATSEPQRSTRFGLVSWFGGGKVGTTVTGGMKSIYKHKGKKRSLKYCFVGAWGV